jgi:hypothetical protein
MNPGPLSAAADEEQTKSDRKIVADYAGFMGGERS